MSDGVAGDPGIKLVCIILCPGETLENAFLEDRERLADDTQGGADRNVS